MARCGPGLTEHRCSGAPLTVRANTASLLRGMSSAAAPVAAIARDDSTALVPCACVLMFGANHPCKITERHADIVDHMRSRHRFIFKSIDYDTPTNFGLRIHDPRAPLRKVHVYQMFTTCDKHASLVVGLHTEPDAVAFSVRSIGPIACPLSYTVTLASPDSDARAHCKLTWQDSMHAFYEPGAVPPNATLDLVVPRSFVSGFLHASDDTGLVLPVEVSVYITGSRDPGVRRRYMFPLAAMTTVHARSPYSESQAPPPVLPPPLPPL